MSSPHWSHVDYLVGRVRRITVMLGLLSIFWPLMVIHRVAFWIDTWLFPWMTKRTVNRPLFIVGIPRSGTTLFHRLVASQQSSFTSLQLWELIFAPALCEKYLFQALYRIDQCIAWRRARGLPGPGERCLRRIQAACLSELDAVHSTGLFALEEDYLGLLPFDGCFLRVLLWPQAKSTWNLAYFSERMPEKRKRYLLSRYKGLLQRHLAFRGDQCTILSKNPSFTTWIDALGSEFPDARFIGLRRSPFEAVPSQLSSLRGGFRLCGHSVDDPRIIASFVDLLSCYWKTLQVTTYRLPGNRYLVLEYSDLTTRPQAIVNESLTQLGYHEPEIPPGRFVELCRQTTRFNSLHRYSLEEFGLSVEEVARRFEMDAVSNAITGGGMRPTCGCDSNLKFRDKAEI